MARLEWGFQPAWRAAVVIAAGLLAFAGSLVIGLALTCLVVWLIPPKVPNPTEAYEGFGDAMVAMFWLAVGGSISVFAAIFVGVAAAVRMAAKWNRRTSPPLSGATPLA